VVGVYSLDLVEKLAEALSMLGLHRALVVHGLDGLDEVTITGPTRIAEVREGNVRSYEVTPEEFGMKRARLEDISGGNAETNAAIIRDILAGTESPRRDVVLLNAAAVLVAAGRADHLGDALPLAGQSTTQALRLPNWKPWYGLRPLHVKHRTRAGPNKSKSEVRGPKSDARYPSLPFSIFQFAPSDWPVRPHSFNQFGHREIFLGFRMKGRLLQIGWFEALQ